MFIENTVEKLVAGINKFRERTLQKSKIWSKKCPLLLHLKIVQKFYFEPLFLNVCH